VSYQPSEDTTSRLLWHAGITTAPEQAGSSIADCTGAAGTSGGLDEALGDLLVTLAQLNRELNGPVPSETANAAHDIPRRVAYAIAEISRMLREDPGTTEHAWAVDTAWNAVLAGDIDNLDEHIRHERAARPR
jgi:hypothetical protein